MNEYLVFRLYGAMSAWGTVAVGEYRPALSYPGKSALLGLLAAALGLRREEEAAQLQLADAYSIAVQVDRHGLLLRDYHTVQAPPTKRGVRYYTRRDELAAPVLNTLLSTRDYHTDAVYTVAVRAVQQDPPYTLMDLKEALERPNFTLYLGRKSCPPALPLRPQIIQAADLLQVFAQVEFPDQEFIGDLLKNAGKSRYWDDREAGLAAQGSLVRRDQPLSRRRWQFRERHVQYQHVNENTED